MHELVHGDRQVRARGLGCLAAENIQAEQEIVQMAAQSVRAAGLGDGLPRGRPRAAQPQLFPKNGDVRRGLDAQPNRSRPDSNHLDRCVDDRKDQTFM
jgi:hypothetical protein